jgi:hypothetical protein
VYAPIAIAFLVFGAPSTSPLSAPTDVADLRARFLAGDLVTLARGRALLQDRGQDVRVGPIALLDDLSRLVRCLPIGPLPDDESPIYRSARMLVRLERVRLESLAKDGAYPESSLADLLVEPPLYPTKVAVDPDLVVRWPLEQERWPGEIIDAQIVASRCPTKAGALKESDPKAHARGRRTRARAIRELLSSLVGELDRLPPETKGEVATAYLDLATAAEGFELPDQWDRALLVALEKSTPPWKSAGLIMLARLRELDEDDQGARVLYREVLERADPTEEEDSRVRTRLAGLTEPRWAEVLDIAHGVKKVRPVDAPALANAEARALYALGRFTELQTFGRAWLRRAHKEDVVDRSTRELLVRLALELEPPEAIAWIEEIGPDDPRNRSERLDELGKLAIEANDLDLAIHIYDKLRTEAGVEEKRTPTAAAEAAHWIAERAIIEFALEDAEAFAGFIDEILLLAQREGERPLARIAPLREIARLCQELIGRITNEVESKPERRKFAALLLEAASALSQKPSRYQPMLEQYTESLKALAGSYAVGRDGRAPLPRRKPSLDAATRKRKRAQKRRVKELGEVVVPRLPPRLETEDVTTAVPSVESFLVYESAGGTWRTGPPWAALVDARKKAKQKARVP